MEVQTSELEIDETRLRNADPDGLYLFMLEDYPYMMTPDHVAAFTGATSQEIRKLLCRGEMQGRRIERQGRVLQNTHRRLRRALCRHSQQWLCEFANHH